jgi:hypothetical protein
MRFAYLLLADASSAGNEGKLNLLGIGVRLLRPTELPAAAQLTIAASIEATSDDEIGPYELELSIENPDGSVDTLNTGEVSFQPDAETPDVPRSIIFVVGLLRSYAQEGTYRIRARVADATADYAFVIRVVPAAT